MKKQKSYGEPYETIKKGYRVKLKIVLPLFFIISFFIILICKLFGMG
ncbi:MAG TPA: hypothetical protein IAC38_00555 [Candidatus Caccovivens faecavium]|nr:hypothetical protein [Candidatus Caccovivens faecavium]